MTKRILSIYYPASVPRHTGFQKWKCLKGYDAAPVVSDSGRVKLVHCRFKAKNRNAAGKRLLFFSDLHYSAREKELADELCSIVEKLKPDVLLSGGDICSDALSIDALPPVLERLSSAVGLCVSIPGNWERGKTWLTVAFWEQFMARHRWHYLCNRSLFLGDWGWVYGCDDISKGFPSVPEISPPDPEKIFLAHRPDTVIALDRNKTLDPFSLVLCGHTHGGQIRLPLIGAVLVPSFYGRRLDCGLFGKGSSDTRMLISTGVNHASFPLRINCRREVILIEFE